MKIHWDKHTTKKDGVNFLGLLGSGGVMCLLIVVLISVSMNIQYKYNNNSLPLLNTTKEENYVDLSGGTTAIIYEKDEMGESSREFMDDVLNQMKIQHDSILCTNFHEKSLANYETLILSVTNYQCMSEFLPYLSRWVEEGGHLMVLYPPTVNGAFASISRLLGIQDYGYDYAKVENIAFEDGFMLGADNLTFTISDAFESGLNVSVDESCHVYVKTVEEYPLPVVWSRDFGKGRVVVDNLGIIEKSVRGFHAAAFSLLEDYCVYPVINGSVFYIDDFPSPVPGGVSTYIERDYNMSISDFYTQVWWKDTYNLAKKYGMVYTGLVIEEYSDQVSGIFEPNRDLERYHYFGNMLLDAGGEIGFHGYNHMPLVLENFDYMGKYDTYKQWESYEYMDAAVHELKRFCSNLYPDLNFQVYVPPSNIISEEGVELLEQEDIGIKAIASVYIPGELAYDQEFNVSETGMINTPRIISGYILDEFCDLTSMCELNMHFVNTHFQHPDDVLDEDRGASLGWGKLYKRISDYCDWLYTSVPQIRSQTGSELAGAVQRYDFIDVHRKDTIDGVEIHLDNFYDEAWFMLRLNKGQNPEKIQGGEMTKINDSIYLIKADKDTLNIRLG